MDTQNVQSIESIIEIANFQLLTVDEVAVILRIAPKTVYQMIRNKQIATVHIGRRAVIRRQDLEEFIKAHLEGRGI